jgi:FAD-dependent oxidoreductase domain-containing protein 1
VRWREGTGFTLQRGASRRRIIPLPPPRAEAKFREPGSLRCQLGQRAGAPLATMREEIRLNFEETACDVAIIGGGVVGCSTAHFIKSAAPHTAVTVIEPDPTYEYASTTRASGGCRVQFSCPENIEMSKFGIQFIRNFASTMSIPGQAPPTVDWVEGGYLFIVPPASVAALEDNVARQRSMGCEVHLLTPAQLKSTFPSMNVDDLGAGAHTPGDGWCDPSGLLWGLRRKAAAEGVTFVRARVVSMELTPRAIARLILDDGATVAAEYFVNAAGAWSGEVAAMAGMQLPVSPLKRYEHYFTAGSPMERLPYVKDTARLAFRSEGKGFSGGLVDGSARRGVDFEIDHDYFERVVWPAAAHRFPPLEAARCHRTWSGLYEQCELDGNPIVGPWKSGRGNLYTVAGFSGHGMMHAPAAGRAIAELLLKGRFETIDLTKFGYERVERNEPYAESGLL